ncbi:hypothetical protein [Paraburkholderia metrosideri]|uniref:hypothetical protein n=1 Tax=Paraburkholderia metrosideri TaxID=580937 RepID=UPI00191ACF9D|nr:hypothetical protein [Paraburkholderia metrosideri]
MLGPMQESCRSGERRAASGGAAHRLAVWIALLLTGLASQRAIVVNVIRTAGQSLLNGYYGS